MRRLSNACKFALLTVISSLLIAVEAFAFGGYGYGMAGAMGGLGGCNMQPGKGAYHERDRVGELRSRRRKIAALLRRKKSELRRAQREYEKHSKAIDMRVKAPYNRHLKDLLAGETDCPYSEQDHSSYIEYEYRYDSKPGYSGDAEQYSGGGGYGTYHELPAGDSYEPPSYEPPAQDPPSYEPPSYEPPADPPVQPPVDPPPPDDPPPPPPTKDGKGGTEAGPPPKYYEGGGEGTDQYYGGEIWHEIGLNQKQNAPRTPAPQRKPASDLPICTRDGRVADVCNPPYAKSSGSVSRCRRAIRYYGRSYHRYQALQDEIDDLEDRYEDFHDRIGLAEAGDYEGAGLSRGGYGGGRGGGGGQNLIGSLLQVGLGIYAINERNKYNRHIAEKNARLGWPTPQRFGYPYGMSGRYGSIPGAMGSGGFGCAGGMNMMPLMMMMMGRGQGGQMGMGPFGMPMMGGGMYMPGMGPMGMSGPWGIGGSPMGMPGMIPGMGQMGPYGFVGHGLGGGGYAVGGLAGFGAPGGLGGYGGYGGYGRGYQTLLNSYPRQPGGLAGYAGYYGQPGLGVGGLTGYGAPAGYGSVGGPNYLMQTSGLRYSMQAQQNQLNYARIRSMGSLQSELSTMQYRMNTPTLSPYTGVNQLGNYGLSSGFGLGGTSGGFVPTLSPSLIPAPTQFGR